MQETEELTGTIDRCLFQSKENGFSVFVLNWGIKQSTIITGHLAHLQPGEPISLQGTWKMHPKFGKQFEVVTCIAHTPTTTIGLKKYLGSGMIKGIGPVYAEKLVDRFGLEVLNVIEHSPERLGNVPGIGSGRIAKIIEAWKTQKAIASIMVFLQERGVTTSLALKIYKKYGANSLKILNENPYQLVDDIWGIGFKTADKIAHQLGMDHHSLARIRAGIAFTISTIVSAGHLYVELEKLRETTLELLELTVENSNELIRQALKSLHENEKIKLITHDGKHFITLTQYYFSEKGVATKIHRLVNQTVEKRFNIDSIYTDLRAPQKGELALNNDQQQGIMTCLQNHVTIITGGPGTGKTTLIKKMLAVLDEHKCTYKLAAPTGRAAKRIQEGTGRFAMTIHRMLEVDMHTMQFAHNEQNALKLDFLIIDEASMIDIFLAHAIIKAMPLHGHLILIGDVDQLPSVGAGNFLNDLIASNTVPTVKLKEIFRQAKDSMIIVNAHRVNHGDFPMGHIQDAKRDFIFIKEDDPAAVPAHLTSIFTKRLHALNINPHEAMVLVPMNRGAVGTQKINYDLQQLLNPHNNEQTVARNGVTYKIGDRVMQIRNNYDKNVFNGDTGTIKLIDREEQTIEVTFGHHDITYEMSELDELILAYAITIHKSQGSEYSAAIIPIFTSHFALLQRNLLYTAITRAKKLCILIGQPKAIAIAIHNNKGVKRITFLKELLTTDVQCR